MTSFSDLSPSQRRVFKAITSLDSFMDGEHAIITGNAGTGKSTVVNAIADDYPVTRTATTGKAAVIVGGTTVDNLFVFERRDNKPYICRDHDRLKKHMRICAQTIVIDEASMVGKHMAEYLLRVADEYDKRLILVGDWAQAAPVQDQWITTSPRFRDVFDIGANAHPSPKGDATPADYDPSDAAYPNTSNIFRLKTQFRQSDGDYLEALNHIRVGSCSSAVYDLVCEATSRYYSTPERELEDAPRLMASNHAVDAYNWQRRDRFSAVFTFYSYAECRREGRVKCPDWLLNSYERDSPFATESEWFAEGCRVMITRNAPMGELIRDDGRMPEYVNGDMGVLEKIHWQRKETRHGQRLTPGAIEVRLDRTQRTVTITPAQQEIHDFSDNIEAVVTGLPIRLGYALSIHKSQGATINQAVVDLSTIQRFPKGSRHGLMYVALSRVTSAKGLYMPHVGLMSKTLLGELIESDPAVSCLI